MVAGRAKARDQSEPTGYGVNALAHAAILISIWSYGAQAVSSREQIVLLNRQLGAQQEELEIAYAELRGLVTFQAEHDPDWSSLILKKSDEKAFEVEELHLIPNYQLDELGVDGEPIPVRPRYDTQNGEHVLRI